jgi:predicted Rossmann fold nucleotide-binding protein DprA/Smf involved in DNA uptake
MGAIPVASADDILEVFGISLEPKNLQFDLSPLEEKVLSALSEPMQKDDLLRKLGMPAQEINPILTMMQVNGVIKESGGEIYRL